MAIILSILEVGLASVCASVPIFWPVLSERVFRVFVTKEVEVTYEERSKLGSVSSRGGDFPSEFVSESHYEDAFIRDQVDPLRERTVAGVETRVRSESVSSKGRRRNRG